MFKWEILKIYKIREIIYYGKYIYKCMCISYEWIKYIVFIGIYVDR